MLCLRCHEGSRHRRFRLFGCGELDRGLACVGFRCVELWDSEPRRRLPLWMDERADSSLARFIAAADVLTPRVAYRLGARLVASAPAVGCMRPRASGVHDALRTVEAPRALRPHAHGIDLRRERSLNGCVFVATWAPTASGGLHEAPTMALVVAPAKAAPRHAYVCTASLRMWLSVRPSRLRADCCEGKCRGTLCLAQAGSSGAQWVSAGVPHAQVGCR